MWVFLCLNNQALFSCSCLTHTDVGHDVVYQARSLSHPFYFSPSLLERTHVQPEAASCLAPVLLCYGKRRGNSPVSKRRRRMVVKKGDQITTDEQMRRKSHCLAGTRHNVSLVLSFLSVVNSPEGKILDAFLHRVAILEKHSSWSLLLQQMSHSRRSLVLNRHPPISARGQSLL